VAARYKHGPNGLNLLPPRRHSGHGRTCRLSPVANDRYRNSEKRNSPHPSCREETHSTVPRTQFSSQKSIFVPRPPDVPACKKRAVALCENSRLCGAGIRFRRPAILFARVRANQGSQCTIDLIKEFIGLENARCLPAEGAAYIRRSRRFRMNRHET
jgi:hypothetical protein